LRGCTDASWCSDHPNTVPGPRVMGTAHPLQNFGVRRKLSSARHKPSPPPSWHRLGPLHVPLEAKRARDVAVAIPVVAVVGLWSALGLPRWLRFGSSTPSVARSSLRLGWWPRVPTRYGNRTESWLRLRWSTRSSGASRRESWPELGSPTTWDRTPPSSMRS